MSARVHIGSKLLDGIDNRAQLGEVGIAVAAGDGVACTFERSPRLRVSDDDFALADRGSDQLLGGLVSIAAPNRSAGPASSALHQARAAKHPGVYITLDKNWGNVTPRTICEKLHWSVHGETPALKSSRAESHG